MLSSPVPVCRQQEWTSQPAVNSEKIAHTMAARIAANCTSAVCGCHERESLFKASCRH